MTRPSDKFITDSPVRLLEEADIFDVYGCQELLQRHLDPADRAEVDARLREVHQIYVTSAKARIRSEARFVGMQLDVALTMEQLMERVRELLAKSMQAKQMAGKPVNLMQEVLKANMAAGMNMEGIDLGRFGLRQEAKQEPPPPPSVDPSWFKKGENSRMWENTKWVEISKAFLRLERADSSNEIIQSIDNLNTLQHNSFHLLIDLQNGRMLETLSGGSLHGDYQTARVNVQLVLDLVNKAKDAYTFADKMSPLVRGLLTRYRKSA